MSCTRTIKVDSQLARLISENFCNLESLTDKVVNLVNKYFQLHSKEQILFDQSGY